MSDRRVRKCVLAPKVSEVISSLGEKNEECHCESPDPNPNLVSSTGSGSGHRGSVVNRGSGKDTNQRGTRSAKAGMRVKPGKSSSAAESRIREELPNLPPAVAPFGTNGGEIRLNAEDSIPEWPEETSAPKNAPNIIVVMTDDVGFGASDTFGGPVATPTFSALADNGIKYNRFHTTALCSPTRASLLTGRLPHNVGSGSIPEWAGGYPGYTTVIPKTAATLGRLLQCQGYSTSWFGKNHNVPLWENSNVGPFDHWPNALGFDKFYGFIGADTDQYHPGVYDNTVPIRPSDGNPDYHFDTDMSDKASAWIKEHHALTPEKPFFMFYVPGATHAPHHVPREWADMYDGHFDDGWDALRIKTLNKMKCMDPPIVPPNTKPTFRPPGLLPWMELSEQQKACYKDFMQVYCGYLSFTDHNIGRMLSTLDECGIRDDTLVIYIMGDNGGSAEGTVDGTTNEIKTVGNHMPEDFSDVVQAHEDGNLGTKMHYNHIPAAWAWALNSPMQWAKRYASHFGGTRNGMVMSYPREIHGGNKIRSEFHHVIDILPTILEAAGLEPEYGSVDGHEQLPLDGKSMVYTWSDDVNATGGHQELMFEMFGNRGLYQNGKMWCTTPQVINWIPESNDPDPAPTAESFQSELYDIDSDFSQGNNLLMLRGGSGQYQVQAELMRTRWMEIAAENNVLPLSFSDSQRVLASSEMPLITKDKSEFEYPAGITRLPELCAPSICNVGSEIKANVTITEADLAKGVEGVVVSLGGRFGGWGIIVMDGGYPTWVYKTSQWEHDTMKLQMNEKLSVGVWNITVKCTLLFPGREDLGGPMRFSLDAARVDVEEPGGQAVSKVFEKTCTARFGVTETFDVGQMSASPLLEELDGKGDYKFTATVNRVKIVLDKSELSVEKAKKMHRAQARFLVDMD